MNLKQQRYKKKNKNKTGFNKGFLTLDETGKASQKGISVLDIILRMNYKK